MASVTVEITRLDLIRCNLQTLLSVRRLWSTFALVGALVVGYVLIRHGVPTTPWNWFVLFLATIGGAAGAVLVGFFVSSLWILIVSSSAPGVLGVHRYTFRDDGLFEQTSANETLLKWQGARSVHPMPAFLVIEVTHALVHLLPRRHFTSDEHYQRFSERAKMLVKGDA
jgi:hypothetical protein